MTAVWAILGTIGGLVAIAVGTAVFDDVLDRVFKGEADRVRLTGAWLFFGGGGLGFLIAAVMVGVSNSGGVLCLLGAVCLFALCVGLTFDYWSTHDRRPKAHDPRRTQPDR